MKKTLSVLLSVLLILSVFSGCGVTSQNDPKTVGEVIDVVYPYDQTVTLHTEKQERYLKGNYKGLIISTGKKELSRPEAVTFSWKYNGEPAENVQYTLKISEHADMTDCTTYTTTDNSLAVYNLKIATTYYWTVATTDFESEVSSFTTDGTAPRNLYVDGITNVRDLGGWVTESGTRTKQGMIFRCGRLNESSADTPKIEITEIGKKTMLEELGIRTEIDVRKVAEGEIGGITESPLGNSVNYVNCPMDWQGDTFNGNHDEILRMFEILSKEESYPLIFHCNIGTDRTGMMAFLINALLGVPEESLCRDYLFSNFGKIGGTRKLKGLTGSVYYQSVQNAEGNTLSEKTYNCLADFGVPPEQLDSVIAILSESN